MSEIYSRDQSLESANPKSEFLKSAQIGLNIVIMTNTFYQYSVAQLTEDQFAIARKRMISVKAYCQDLGDIEAALFFAERFFLNFFNKPPDELAELYLDDSKESGWSCLALGRQFWQIFEAFAYEIGLINWRGFLNKRVLPERLEDISLAATSEK